jgi:CBS domain-containing protein
MTVVEEFMNREVLVARTHERGQAVLRHLLALRVSGAPVVGADGRVVGVVSWKDLIDSDDEIRELMTTPPATIAVDADVAQAAWLLVDTGYHRLVVVDSARRPCGVLSTLDVVRALVGGSGSATEPSTTRRADDGLQWSEDVPLEQGTVAAVPEEPGVLSLVRVDLGRKGPVAWVEATQNLRSRLQQLLTDPGHHVPRLVDAIASKTVRCRYATTADVERQTHALKQVLYAARQQRRESQRGHAGAGDVEE